MENYKSDYQKALELINRCEYQEEALELLKDFFYDKPVKLDIKCLVAFSDLRLASHPFKNNK